MFKPVTIKIALWVHDFYLNYTENFSFMLSLFKFLVKYGVNLHCGVPEEIVNINGLLFEELKCKVVYDGRLSGEFAVTTGVWQGYLLRQNIEV